jgi:hypothetical protein
VNYPSAKASELPDSTTDICLYGYIPRKPEVAISKEVDSLSICHALVEVIIDYKND